MENLLEIVKIISKNRLRKIESLHDEAFNISNSVYARTYHLLKDGKVNTDVEIARRNGVNVRSNKYRIFKSRFKERLINSLFFLDIRKKEFSQSLKSEYICHRNKHIINTLFLLGARRAAAELSVKTLAMAEKFELAEIASYCSKMLRSQSSTEGNIKDFDYYNLLTKKYFEIQNFEDQALGMVENIYLHFASSASVKPELIKIANDYVKKIEKYRKVHYTYRLNLYYYRLLGLSYQLQFNHKALINACEKFETYLKTQPEYFNINLRLAESALNQLSGYLYLKDYESGELCSKKCRELFPAGTNNWFFFMEYYFLLSMHCKEYKNALLVLHEIKSHPRFIHLQENRKEKWLIYRTYLALVYQEVYDINGEALEFNENGNLVYDELVKKTVIYSKDKKGYNIHLLIIQTIHYLENKNHIAATDRIDAIKRYITRYLKVEYAYRSYIFLRLIVEAGNANYDYNTTISKTKKLLIKLNASNTIFNDSLEITEIIPYEDLWEILLSKIK